jgi:hypothetical protein
MGFPQGTTVEEQDYEHGNMHRPRNSLARIWWVGAPLGPNASVEPSRLRGGEREISVT